MSKSIVETSRETFFNNVSSSHDLYQKIGNMIDHKSSDSTTHFYIHYIMDQDSMNSMILDALASGRLGLSQLEERYNVICDSIETREKINRLWILGKPKGSTTSPPQSKASLYMKKGEMDGFEEYDVSKDDGEGLISGSKPLFQFNIIRFTIRHSKEVRTNIDMVFVGNVYYTSICSDRFKMVSKEVVLNQFASSSGKRVATTPCELYKSDFFPSGKRTANSKQPISTHYFRPSPVLLQQLISRFEKSCGWEEFEILSRICQCARISTVEDYEILVKHLLLCKNKELIGQLFYPLELYLKFLTSPALHDFFGAKSVLRVYLPAYFGNKTAQAHLKQIAERNDFELKTNFLKVQPNEFGLDPYLYPKNALSNLYCNGKHHGDDAREICTYVFRYWTSHRSEEMMQMMRRCINILNTNLHPIPFLTQWRALSCYVCVFLDKDKSCLEYLKSVDHALFYHYLSLNSSNKSAHCKESMRRGIVEDGLNEVLSNSDSQLGLSNHQLNRLSFGNEEWLRHMLSPTSDDDLDYEYLLNNDLYNTTC